MTKDNLRREIRRLRDRLAPQERKMASEVIASRLMALPQWEKARVIFSYLSIQSEVETESLILEAMRQGKIIAVPHTDYERHIVIPSVLKDLGQDLICRRFGLLEPSKKSLRPLAAADIDITVIPGCVFDPRGGRIGYGMGFYDRFLLNLREDSLKIGLAYEIQIVPRVPVQEHDCLMDMIITEKRTISLRI